MYSSKFKIICALAAVYLIWGSTYLAIRFAIETMPSFMMAGMRFLISGILLYGYCICRGLDRQPTLNQWKNAAIIGGLLLLGGNGSVVWAEHYVPSGLAALIIAMTPWWMALLGWIFFKGIKPNWLTLIGLLLGFIGVGLLIVPVLNGHLHLVGVVVLILASLWWSIGSLYSKQADLPSSVFLSTAMQMICGGVILLLVSLGCGEWNHLSDLNLSIKSWMAFGYLIIFGSFVGYTAYIWLLQEVSATLASSYAFVNPLVAVLLGWLFAAERLNSHTLWAACLIVCAVVLITLTSKESVFKKKVTKK